MPHRIENRTAYVACPECHEAAGLHDHDIADDGTVSPSVVCPHPGCSWHVWIKLKDWKE